MSKFNTIGIDLAKQIFQVHINDANGKKLSSKKLKRSQLLDYIGQQPNALVAIEACSGAHWWARQFQSLGHAVKDDTSSVRKTVCSDA